MLGAVVGVLSLACGGVPWGDEAFSTPVAEVQALAAQPSPEEGVTPLYRSLRWSLDEARRVRTVSRDVVRLQGAAAIERWSTISFRYAPTLEDMPVIRARVVTPEGRVYELTPELVSQRAAATEPGTVSDQRLASAALPGLRSGAVVELEVTSQARVVTLPAAQAGRFVVDERRDGDVTIVIEHPRSVPVKVSSRRLSLSRREEDDGPRHRIVLQGSSLVVQGGGRGDVTWSSGRSWQAVARAYGEVLAGARQGQPAVDARALVAGATSRREKAQRVLDWLRGEVRYTGLHFGDRGAVPWSPAQVLERGFGDCKDLSLLVVEVLAAAGVEARLALLDTERRLDPALPALSFFDHAIVVLPATKTEPATWLDPTAPSFPAGLLPPSYAGEPALIVDDASTGLVPTPALSSADASWSRHLDVELPAYGPGAVRVTEQYHGVLAALGREVRQRQGEAWLPTMLDLLSEDVAHGPLESTEVPSSVATEPLVVGGRASRARGAFVAWEEALVEVADDVLLGWVPRSLLEETPPPLRDGHLRMQPPHVATLVLRVRAPPGFEVSALPPATTERWGPATYGVSTVTRDDGRVELTLRLDTGKRDYSAADVAAFRAAYRAWRASPPTALRFATGASRFDAARQPRQLVEWYARARAAHPGDVGLEARYAVQLLEFGLGAAARERSRRLVLDPKASAVAWASRGWILSRDSLGRDIRGDFDRRSAISALERALELEPECDFCAERLAYLERTSDDGQWLPPSMDRARALKAFARAWPDDRGSDDWVALMVAAEQWATLRSALAAPTTDAQAGGALLADVVLDGATVAWAKWQGRLDGPRLTRACELALYLLLSGKRSELARALATAARGSRVVESFEVAQAARAPGAPHAAALATLDAVLLASVSTAGAERQRVVRELVTQVPGGVPVANWLELQAGDAELTPQATAQTVQAGLHFMTPSVAEGPRDGRRLTVNVGAQQQHFYLVKRDQRWRVLAVSSSADLAAWALRRFEERRPEDAEAWLRWALEQFEREPDHLLDPEVRSLRVWGKPAPQLLAAALASHRPEARRRLEAALLSATLATKSELLKLLLVGAALDGARGESRQWADALAAHAPTARSTLSWRLWERWKAEDLEGQRAVVEAWRGHAPKDPSLLVGAAHLELASGDATAALELYRARLAQPGATPAIFERAAFAALVAGVTTPEVVEWARQGSPEGAAWTAQVVRALVLASRGEDLAGAVALAQRRPTGSEGLAALLVGRVAEALGLDAEARAQYLAARGDAVTPGTPGTPGALAAQWLAQLDGRAAERHSR
jgi:hypothetical protein